MQFIQGKTVTRQEMIKEIGHLRQPAVAQVLQMLLSSPFELQVAGFFFFNTFDQGCDLVGSLDNLLVLLILLLKKKSGSYTEASSGGSMASSFLRARSSSW